MSQRLIHRTCAIASAILWTLSATLMAFALDGEPLALSDAALLIGLAACVPTGHLVVEYAARVSREVMTEEVEAIVARERELLIETLCEVVGRADAERVVRRIGE